MNKNCCKFDLYCSRVCRFNERLVSSDPHQISFQKLCEICEIWQESVRDVTQSFLYSFLEQKSGWCFSHIGLSNGQKFQNVENEEKMKWHFWEVFYTFTTYICSLVWEFNKSLAIYYRIFCCSAIWKQQLLKVQNLTKT